MCTAVATQVLRRHSVMYGTEMCLHQRLCHNRTLFRGTHRDGSCLKVLKVESVSSSRPRAAKATQFHKERHTSRAQCNATTGVIVRRAFGVLLRRAKPCQGLSSVMHKYQVEPSSRLV